MRGTVTGLLILGGLADDPQGILTAVEPLARMLRKLLPKALLRINRSLEGVQRDFERGGAKCADANGGDGAKPFDHSEIAFCHALSLAHGSAGLSACGFQTAPLPKTRYCPNLL